MNHADGWMNGWMGGGMWLWTVIGVVVVVLLVVVIGKISKKYFSYPVLPRNELVLIE